MKKMRIRNGLVLLVLIYLLSSCTGPRNLYSSSPFVSPVAMTKGTTAAEATYFTHTRQPNVTVDLEKNHDNCFSLGISHMLTEKMLMFANWETYKEGNQFGDSIPVAGDLSFNAYNAGFDSSILSVSRYSLHAGVEFFPGDQEKTTTSSFALLAGWHHLNMNESGLLHRTPYRRFYDMNQASLSLQYNLLFNITNSMRLAWVIRLTVLKNFVASTDYSSDEKVNAGLHDNNVNAFLCGTGLYADCKPFGNIPVYLTGQFFNDLAGWKHSFAKWEPGRVYSKGTGVAMGLKYLF